MSRFSGPQGRGAMRVYRATAREAALERQSSEQARDAARARESRRALAEWRRTPEGRRAASRMRRLEQQWAAFFNPQT